MRRSLDDALLALRNHARACAHGSLRPDVRVLVYPPEREAQMLARLPGLAAEWAADGLPVEVVDVGQRLRDELEARPHRLEQLLRDDAAGRATVPGNLGTIAAAMLERLLRSPLDPPACCRILANTGALAAFVSYSAITNGLYDSVPSPCVVLFPGEGDDRALNILNLRSDPTYRVPRL